MLNKREKCRQPWPCLIGERSPPTPSFFIPRCPTKMERKSQSEGKGLHAR